MIDIDHLLLRVFMFISEQKLTVRVHLPLLPARWATVNEDIQKEGWRRFERIWGEGGRFGGLGPLTAAHVVGR